MCQLNILVSNGEIDPSQFMTKSRLSYPKIADFLNCGQDLSSNSLASDPQLNRTYRQLKMTCEGVDLTVKEIEKKFCNLIHEIKEYCKTMPSINSATALSQPSGRWDLYKEAIKTPFSSTIFRLARLTAGRPDYWYWEDDEIIAKACDCDSLTELKYADGTLHRHIKGRNLESKLVMAKPCYAKHFYVGHDGWSYRSVPELIAGNYFYLSGIDYRHEVNTFLRSGGSSKSRVADFYLPEYLLFIEIVQNEAGDRGARRKSYQQRNCSKYELYKKGNLCCIFINSDPYYNRGVFNAIEFIEALRTELSKKGINTGAPPPIADLVYRDDLVKMKVINEPSETIVQYLRGLGVDGIKTLQDNFSSILTLLQYRPDYQAIRDQIKRENSLKKSELLKLHHKNNREKYAPINIVKAFCIEKGITKQKEWFKYAKEHKTELKRLRIPSSLNTVYKRLNTWNGWRSVLAPIVD
jgi:hypothetical protein